MCLYIPAKCYICAMCVCYDDEKILRPLTVVPHNYDG